MWKFIISIIIGMLSFEIINYFVFKNDRKKIKYALIADVIIFIIVLFLLECL